ncbi:predicted protein [Pyrenophora tritici-repentis Pt-1C-BFP]|uniref:Uncharacterized protein n=1 Tax=Pyrenophora tritici-repentis (strain Pt-1C-BFP) TaxID=426418 RepID=B2VRF7_PYRTR|nr:uncharacterized protein PTRG_00138 [Pyrenophora tritici-repentis Pt-1C-BFP]EDU39576.1 predicted protein [Pyrenophora tritici-repentis Pt-1C-BFP]
MDGRVAAKDGGEPKARVKRRNKHGWKGRQSRGRRSERKSKVRDGTANWELEVTALTAASLFGTGVGGERH